MKKEGVCKSVITTQNFSYLFILVVVGGDARECYYYTTAFHYYYNILLLSLWLAISPSMFLKGIPQDVSSP